MKRPIRLGISTCPNDTFAFHALMTRQVSWQGLDFEVELLDIQELNQRLFAGDYDVAKTSFHAALRSTRETVVLPSGSALGFGVGPLLLAAEPDALPRTMDQLTLCPGEHTTATLLFRLFYPQTTVVEQVVFSEIMPRLACRKADFGVCIHEGRFTWQSQGLHLVEDLGTRWEQETGHPLPLGGLVARRNLTAATIQTIQDVIHSSLQFALNDPEAALPTMREHAQEFDDRVLMKHVQLYVNDWTIDLGRTGEAALAELCQRARDVDLLPADAPPLQITRDLQSNTSGPSDG